MPPEAAASPRDFDRSRASRARRVVAGRDYVWNEFRRRPAAVSVSSAAACAAQGGREAWLGDVVGLGDGVAHGVSLAVDEAGESGVSWSGASTAFYDTAASPGSLPTPDAAVGGGGGYFGASNSVGAGGGGGGVVKAGEARKRLSALANKGTAGSGNGDSGAGGGAGGSRSRGSSGVNSQVNSRASSVDSHDMRDPASGGLGSGGQLSGHMSPSSITSGMSVTRSLFPGVGGKRVEEGVVKGSPKTSGRHSINAADDSLAMVGGGSQGFSYYLLLCLQGLTGGSLAVLLSALLFLFAFLPLMRSCAAASWIPGGGGVGGHEGAAVSAWSVLQCVLGSQGAGEREGVEGATKPTRVPGNIHACVGGACRREEEQYKQDGLDGMVVSMVWTLVAMNLTCSAAAAVWALSDFLVCSGRHSFPCYCRVSRHENAQGLI